MTRHEDAVQNDLGLFRTPLRLGLDSGVAMRYDPATFKSLGFHDAVPHFATGKDTPRAFLERCLQQIAVRDLVVKAFVVVNEALAREAADASSARWKAGRPLSAIDGMPMAAATWAWGQAGAGAVFLGQTVTAELALAQAGRTTHPFDVTRTPGGASAAAVAARMCAAALDTQDSGCVIRSASYCGNFALKPTPGALNIGVHAGSIEDLWQVALAIAQRAGGNSAHVGLAGSGLKSEVRLAVTPEATRPGGLIVIESAGWRAAGEATRTAFEALMDQIACAGVTLLRRRDHPAIEAFEQAIVHVDERALAQLAHAALAPLADALVMLSAPGPAPLCAGDPPSDRLVRRSSGEALCHTPSALLHAPAVALPLMGVEGMPVGVQLMGQCHEDARVLALACWVAREAGKVVV